MRARRRPAQLHLWTIGLAVLELAQCGLDAGQRNSNFCRHRCSARFANTPSPAFHLRCLMAQRASCHPMELPCRMARGTDVVRSVARPLGINSLRRYRLARPQTHRSVTPRGFVQAVTKSLRPIVVREAVQTVTKSLRPIVVREAVQTGTKSLRPIVVREAVQPGTKSLRPIVVREAVQTVTKSVRPIVVREAVQTVTKSESKEGSTRVPQICGPSALRCSSSHNAGSTQINATHCCLPPPLHQILRPPFSIFPPPLPIVALPLHCRRLHLPTSAVERTVEFSAFFPPSSDGCRERCCSTTSSNSAASEVDVRVPTASTSSATSEVDVRVPTASTDSATSEVDVRVPTASTNSATSEVDARVRVPTASTSSPLKSAQQLLLAD